MFHVLIKLKCYLLVLEAFLKKLIINNYFENGKKLNSFILSIHISMIKRINEQLLFPLIYIVVINYVMKAFHNNAIFKFHLLNERVIIRYMLVT